LSGDVRKLSRTGAAETAALGFSWEIRATTKFWGYGAEVLDPDGYMNHLWDEVTMARAMGEMSEEAEQR